MTTPDKVTLGVGAAAVLVGIGLVLAQELGDADFRNVTIEGSGTTPLSLGNNTSKDICVVFNEDTLDDTLCFIDATGKMLFDTAGLGISSVQPQMQFFDTDLSASMTAAGNFSVNYGAPEADDSEFVIAILVGGTNIADAFSLTSSTNENYMLSIRKGTADFDVGYTGLNGSQFAFLRGAQGYYFDDDLYVDEASPGGIFLQDTGGACYKCSLATTQTYSPSNVTTDRTYDANATTVDELADVLGTLIADLDTLNHVGTSTDNVLVCTATTCPSVTP